jgi:hypothetical protein
MSDPARKMSQFQNNAVIGGAFSAWLVVATRPEELPRLCDLFDRGDHNGLRGLV